MPSATRPPARPREVERAKQIFRFLKDFSERNTLLPRSLAEQLWHLPLRDLPAHPSISIGHVTLASPSPDGSPTEPAPAAPLLRIGRPSLTAAPEPPEVLRDLLLPGWDDPATDPALLPRRTRRRAGATFLEIADDDPARTSAFEAWKSARAPWADSERLARAAMRTFEQFYELHARLERESERVELLLGDGRLLWRRGEELVDHPLLLQRVDLVFDPDRAEFRLEDSDRAPELYGVLLQSQDGLHGAELTSLRAELEQGGFHALEGPSTSAFLRRIAGLLGPHGGFREWLESAGPSPDPLIVRDPVLFLRARVSGFSAAFDRVLADLENASSLPAALTRLAGIDPPPHNDDAAPAHSPWAEPPDVLLCKPANAEQIRIARALESHGAVLVQGPPGTGKSHTIANLIGHLVAQGKRVLVTSHTTKALRVLRSQIVDTLQPLCVSVLDQDLESRSQLEQSVRGILSRLTEASEGELERESEGFARTRENLNERIEELTRALRESREAEYAPIALAGESVAPAEAARWVCEREPECSWIPAPVEPGAPAPLEPAEVRRLYELNGLVSAEEEKEIDAPPPERSELPDLRAFETMLAEIDAAESPDDARFWDRAPDEADLPALDALRSAARDAAFELARFTGWQRAIVAAGHAGGSARGLWAELAGRIRAAVAARERALPLLLERTVEVAADLPAPKARSAAEDLAARGGKAGGLALLLHPGWKAVLRGALVNGKAPGSEADFRAIAAHVELEQSRIALAERWKRQAEPAGLAKVADLGKDPEPVMNEYAESIDSLLDWWASRRGEIEAHAARCGFRWAELRRSEVATSAPAAPFERDAAVIAGPLPRVVEVRLAAATRARAMRQLSGLESALAARAGRACAALRAAVRGRDAGAYEAALEALAALLAKREPAAERRALVDRVAGCAPAWAAELRGREGLHGAASAPGDPRAAWRWRQLAQEIERRAALDERALARELQARRQELRAATSELIDRRAWLAQLRRTRLSERQALQGWADTVRKIGRGTGKRVPELQAKARRLLAEARDAVPVWIMPLQRVAESFEPSRGRFDVVIVDEASQSDVTALLAWYLGDRVAIVGDHEQVSPMAVGLDVRTTNALIAQHLQGVPNSHLYDGTTSIYDLARQSFGGTIALREHFRCVPDIIEFSNALSYDSEIRPLRSPTSAPMPHVVEFLAGPELGSRRDGKRNEAEARVVAALLLAATELPEHAGKSFGAISLLGDEQAGRIQQLALRLVGAVELERRRFAAGNPAQFQGDERDVVFLSMVDAPEEGALAMRQTDAFKQRYNVAVSRARDQVWLVHSLDPLRDLQKGDLRRRLIEHVRDPSASQRVRLGPGQRAGSPFEAALLRRLAAAGYAAEPGVWIGRQRIDIVVRGAGGEIAIECEGDRPNPAGRIGEDMARQAVLERAGWPFVRIRCTRFLRDPDRTMGWIAAELASLGVEPAPLAEVERRRGERGTELRDRIVKRAQAILKEQGWLEDASASVS
jgi:very-short-patch-repair endonuclease